MSETAPSSVPDHIAFIMDGNGRWAKNRGRLRLHGHEKGAASLRRITQYCRSIGVREVTFYALSTENFARRPALEIAFLMKLLKRFLIQERPELTANGIRFEVIGDVHELSADVRREIDVTVDLTRDLDDMVMRLALNYGARQEIIEAVKRMLRQVAAGSLDSHDIEALDEGTFRQYLSDPKMSDPDLIVRTAGEYRLSNFLLWHASYSEWWVSPVLWPDFDIPHLKEALADFGGRERRYGSVGSDSVAKAAGPEKVVSAERVPDVE